MFKCYTFFLYLVGISVIGMFFRDSLEVVLKFSEGLFESSISDGDALYLFSERCFYVLKDNNGMNGIRIAIRKRYEVTVEDSETIKSELVGTELVPELTR